MGAGAVFGRVLVKLSGESLMGDLEYGIEPARVTAIAGAVRDCIATGVQLAIVPGGGNIYRGLKGAAEGMDRATGDYMGMLATVLNALALQDACEKAGVHTRVQSAMTVQEVAEPYIRRRAMRHLEKGRVVIFAAGTGNPFFTTDTCAALRASELQADVLFKATKVDGVFTADPVTDPSARKFERLDYGEVLKRQLGVMDLAAVSLCMESRIPVIVFRLATAGNLLRAIQGEAVGTIIAAR